MRKMSDKQSQKAKSSFDNQENLKKYDRRAKEIVDNKLIELKNECEKNGISREDLAERAAVSIDSIKNYFSNSVQKTYNPSMQNYIRMALVAGVDLKLNDFDDKLIIELSLVEQMWLKKEYYTIHEKYGSAPFWDEHQELNSSEEDWVQFENYIDVLVDIENMKIILEKAFELVEYSETGKAEFDSGSAEIINAVVDEKIKDYLNKIKKFEK